MLAASSSLSWVRAGDGIVGLGESVRLPLGRRGLSEAADLWRDLSARSRVDDQVRLPGSGLVAFVSASFAPDDGVLVVPEVIVGRAKHTTWLTTIGDADKSKLRDAVAPLPHGPVRVRDGSLDQARWRDAVADAVRLIGLGEVDKVVLARDLVADCDDDLDLRWLVRRLAAAYPTCWTYLVDGLVGATPELLIASRKGLAMSRILAGTIRRTGDDEHDLALAASLARSGKDLEEHAYAVQSVADILSWHCKTLNVPESPFVLHLPNVMHLATDVTGPLRHGRRRTSVLDLAADLHPSAAVCGTPRDKASQVIADLEHMDRGRYAGPVGWVDSHGDGEIGIALRCGQQTGPRQIRLFAGCGIVNGSDPEAELAETEAKLEPVLSALGVAPHHLGRPLVRVATETD